MTGSIARRVRVRAARVEVTKRLRAALNARRDAPRTEPAGRTVSHHMSESHVAIWRRARP